MAESESTTVGGAEKVSDKPAPQHGAPGEIDDHLTEVLESAARLQRLVPDAVLVGGSAADFYARHRDSYDHDHVLADLKNRYELVLEAIESEGDWVTNRTTYGKIILGALGGIETGVRQMIRKRPLEVVLVTLPSGAELRVPTLAEILRIKAFLAVRRNQVRDYLDIAALADSMGYAEAAGVLSGIDDFYSDQRGESDDVSAQVARQLADPRPRDASVTTELRHYKGLVRRWHDWSAVVAACRRVATLMLDQPTHPEG